ncbi:MAG: UvrD-helicase domain-containing protein [Bryobacterales bacterium]|nr:UvrD-helicase domain-containing protein [Bryobacterales bacterium]
MSIGLNSAQRAAVERWGQDVCVVAGPGSGKTRVLIERFRWLVEAKGIDPQRILAVTFTEKAATEIKKRLMESVASTGDMRQQMERAWVSTIHGFCTRLLKENAIAASVDPDFRLLDEPQARILGRRSAEAVLDALLGEEPAAMRTLLLELNVGSSDLAQALQDLYAEARSAGVPVESLAAPEPSGDGWTQLQEEARVIVNEPLPFGNLKHKEVHQRFQQWARRVAGMPPVTTWRDKLSMLDAMPALKGLKPGSRAREAAKKLHETHVPQAKAAILLGERLPLYGLCLEALRRIHAAYREAKRDAGVLDFEDLQECAIRLLEENAGLRERVRQSFDQVLMDELQDTNRLQWRLVNLVRRPDSLFAVGDINQSIYYFRHADPSVFQDYRNSLAAEGKAIDELHENYRSRAVIIDAVNAITPFLSGGVEMHRLQALREYPHKTEPSIEFTCTYAGHPEDDAARTEARWIANRIRQLEGTLTAGKQGEQRLARFSDMAVLARTIHSLAAVQQALDEYGIPCSVSGGRSFYETREVRDLTAWLCVLANPLDELALATVLRSPLAGVSDETLLRLKLAADTLIGAVEASEDERLVWLRGLVREQRGAADATPPDALLQRVLDESSYMDGLAPRAKANIAKLLGMLRDRFTRRPSTLGELADELREWRESGSQAEAGAEEVVNSVKLMSVHAAKGLEFPIVFVAALRNGAQSREPVFCFNERRELGVTWRHPGERSGISDPVHLRVCAAKKRLEAGEEDRLLYVALTRAEEHLILTAGPVGSGDWAKRVCDGLRLPQEKPERERSETLHGVELTHTRLVAAVARRESKALLHDVLTVERPPREGEQEAVAPVTSVAQHAFCPRQYYLARYLGLDAAQRTPSEPEAEDARDEIGEWPASEFGVMVHELLAGTAVDNPPEAAMAMARGFEQSAWGQRAARARRIGREFDFLIEMEGMILRGQIDLWFEEGGELVLLDYKSDQVTMGEEWRHASRYRPQLRLYALALERLTGRLPDAALLWYLRTGAAVKVGLGAEAMEEARGQVRALREAQAGLNFPLREGSHCLRCGYYQGACPSGFKEDPAPPISPE